MVTPGKCSLTQVTLERFAARVLPQVSRQFIGAGKPPVTVGPGARVGLLPRVRPLVGLQVGALGVDFVTNITMVVPPDQGSSRGGEGEGRPSLASDQLLEPGQTRQVDGSQLFLHGDGQLV